MPRRTLWRRMRPLRARLHLTMRPRHLSRIHVTPAQPDPPGPRGQDGEASYRLPGSSGAERWWSVRLPASATARRISSRRTSLGAWARRRARRRRACSGDLHSGGMAASTRARAASSAWWSWRWETWRHQRSSAHRTGRMSRSRTLGRGGLRSRSRLRRTFRCSSVSGGLARLNLSTAPAPPTPSCRPRAGPRPSAWRGRRRWRAPVRAAPHPPPRAAAAAARRAGP